MAFGKRKRVYAPRRNGTKKRKSSFKRASRRGGRRTADFTSLNTRGTSIGFRGRKVSRRAFKKHLWDSTLFKSHYRSVRAIAGDVVTQTNDVASTIFGLNMYKFDANPFWTSTGGAVTVDTGVTLPTFIGDIILRGGVYTATFANTSANDVKLNLYYTTTVPDPVITIVPTTSAISWDPSVTPDFNSQVGKPWMNKTVLLEGGNSYSISHRFKIQKIDQTTYIVEGLTPIIWVCLSNIGNSSANTIRVARSYNLSFSADAQ